MSYRYKAAGAACPRCYRPIDDTHEESACVLAGSFSGAAAEELIQDIVRVLDVDLSGGFIEADIARENERVG